MGTTVSATSDDAEHALFKQKTGPLARLQHLLHTYPVLSPAGVLVIACAFFTYFGDGKFLVAANFGRVFQQTAVVATLAVGQTLVVLTAGIDLSLGAAMLFTSMVVARLAVDHGWNGGVALAVGLLLGAVLGFLNGVLVTRLKLPPFIVTLGTFYVFQALGLIYGQARTISFDSPSTKDSALVWSGKIINIGTMQITTGVVMCVALYAVFSYVLSNTAWGRHVYAIGDDAEAAGLAGIDVPRVQLSVYVVAGLIYGFAAWIVMGRSLSASMNNADNANLETITAVVIGGTSLFGGRGLLWGSLIGAFIVSIFNNGLSLAGVNTNYRLLTIGILIVVAVALDQWIRKLRK